MKEIKYIPLKTVDEEGGYSRPGNAGYVSINNFDDSKKQDLEEALEALKAANDDGFLDKIDGYTVVFENGKTEAIARALKNIYIVRDLGVTAKLGREHKEKYMKQKP